MVMLLLIIVVIVAGALLLNMQNKQSSADEASRSLKEKELELQRAKLAAEKDAKSREIALQEEKIRFENDANMRKQATEELEKCRATLGDVTGVSCKLDEHSRAFASCDGDTYGDNCSQVCETPFIIYTADASGKGVPRGTCECPRTHMYEGRASCTPKSACMQNYKGNTCSQCVGKRVQGADGTCKACPPEFHFADPQDCGETKSACVDGWMGPNCDRCPPPKVVNDSICACPDGYEYADRMLCGVDVNTAGTEGEQAAADACREGFSGMNCSVSDIDVCNHGKLDSHGECACDLLYSGDVCEVECSGNGRVKKLSNAELIFAAMFPNFVGPSRTSKCVCDEDFAGHFCEKSVKDTVCRVTIYDHQGCKDDKSGITFKNVAVDESLKIPRIGGLGDKVSSVKIERVHKKDGSAALGSECQVTFFKNDNFEDCRWNIKLASGARSLLSQHFNGDAGDSASSLIIQHGNAAETEMPFLIHKCSNVSYSLESCQQCTETSEGVCKCNPAGRCDGATADIN